jgi:integrase
MSLKKARDEAKKIAANHLDPAGEREREREVKNFAGLAAAFLKAQEGELRPSSMREYRRIVDDVLVPQLGALPPSKISRLAIKDLLKDRLKEHPVMANRIRAIAHRIFVWAAENDISTNNPVAGIKAKKESKRSHVLKHDEIRKIWKSLDKESPVPQSFMRVLFLTGLRRSEVLGANWSDVDFEGGYWRIPAVATKSQMRLDVPLTPRLRAIFDSLKPFSAAKTYVFASFHADEDVPISGISQLKRRIDKRSEVKDWRLHDVRRTVITMLGDMGAPDEIKRALLGHAISGALGHYDMSSLAIQKREWLERWQTKLEQIVTLKEGAEVGEMKRLRY